MIKSINELTFVLFFFPIVILLIVALPQNSQAQTIRLAVCQNIETGRVVARRGCRGNKFIPVNQELLTSLATAVPGPIGPQGETGPIGPQGDTGPAGVLQLVRGAGSILGFVSGDGNLISGGALGNGMVIGKESETSVLRVSAEFTPTVNNNGTLGAQCLFQLRLISTLSPSEAFNASGDTSAQINTDVPGTVLFGSTVLPPSGAMTSPVRTEAIFEGLSAGIYQPVLRATSFGIVEGGNCLLLSQNLSPLNGNSNFHITIEEIEPHL